MMPRQLTIDGREEAHPPRLAGLTERQREVLRFIRGRSEVRPIEVGLVLHAGRERPCRQAQQAPGHSPRSGACCAYTSSDGSAALRRLAARGLVERVAHGRWRAIWQSEHWTPRVRVNGEEIVR
jgi:hypothetical protein